MLLENEPNEHLERAGSNTITGPAKGVHSGMRKIKFIESVGAQRRPRGSGLVKRPPDRSAPGRGVTKRSPGGRRGATSM
jgi:hypothetical protein